MQGKLARRAFIKNSIQAAGITAFIALPGSGNAVSFNTADKEYTVQDVIDIILKEIPGAPFKQTVDTLKSGTASQKVTGIVTTMFATVKIIEEAARLKANFIIAHEPTFYNHTDDVNWVPGSETVKQKQALLQKHGIAVWRFHDQWHSHRPDGILYGVLKKTGWTQYYTPGNPVIEVPAASLKDIITHLKSSLGIEHVRVIGNLAQSCKRIVLMPGAAGGQMQMGVVEKQHPDVLIVGEVHEWETAEYIRDSLRLGTKTSLVVLGHSVSEEPGMEWLVEWLQPKVPGLAVTHIASGNPFTWV
ncbi:MAG TPA: Nif3-like dinuclear metal center hexameric protein [Chitinophagaceae bacterium]|nr:Nif3-like dinuclear metal center hexameric protein [Chitinophagaceae bacterium]